MDPTFNAVVFVKLHVPQLNLVMAWSWMLLGFVSGMVLGMRFHKEGWLGGYGSLQRRLYRLGHISCFALGAVNLLFALTIITLGARGAGVEIASWGFVIGAISMPVCCVIMAHRPKLHLIFAIPVVSLLVAATFTLLEVIKL